MASKKTPVKAVPVKERKPVQNVLRNKHGRHHKSSDLLAWRITYKTFTIAGKTVKAIYLIYAGFLLMAMILAGIGYASLHNFYDECRKEEYKALSKLDSNTFRESGVTTIYDKDGNVLATLHNTGYKYVKINEISEDLQNTYISSEDKTFMEHPGFSVRGIARAGKALLDNRGEITQGGSTITQQLVKNTLLSSEQTFKRKLTEIFLAVDLEKKFTKPDIMEYYLNTCFYGNNCRGIYAASQYYFGKDPSEITYKEAAMLAGISKSPSIYNPEADYGKSITERNIVLKGLYSDGLITKEQYESFVSEEYSIRDHQSVQEKSDYRVSFTVYCAARRLMAEDGFKFRYTFKNKDEETAYDKKYRQTYLTASDKIRNGGFSVYTSLDGSIQKKLQKAVDNGMSAVSLVKAEDGRYETQGSATCIDNTTGLVAAIVGGRGTSDEYNRAFLSERQPGSSIKPVLDYGPAFDTGKYFPSRIVNDKAIKNGPKNAGGGYRGLVSVRYAIADSINTVAYNVLQDIGVKNGLTYLEKMGFSSLSYIDNNNSAAAIGGFTNGVKNYELAGAYAAIENGGVWRDPTCITEIKSSLYGIEIKDTEKARSRTIYKSSSAYMLTSCMQDVFKAGGTGKGLGIKGQACAGKTGTTNSMKDGWFVGYTPYYTTAVWVGNDDGKPVAHNYGAVYAGKIWNKFMTDLHKGLVKKNFDVPDTVEKLPVGAGGAPAQYGAKKDWFATDTENTAEDTAIEDEQKRQEEAAEKALKKYEAFYITSEDDVFEQDDLYRAASDAIAACDDDSARNEFLERLETKEEALAEETAKYGDLTEAREAYEKAKELEETSKREQEQQEKTENNRIENAVQRFEEAEDMVNNADSYDTSLESALSVMSDNLDDLTDIEEYDEYKARLNSASDKVSRLKEAADRQDDTDAGVSEEGGAE